MSPDGNIREQQGKEAAASPTRYAELVGERLRKLRQQAGLSLQEAAERSGGSFAVSTLSAYETGKRSLTLERIVELASLYGVSPAALLEGEDTPESYAQRTRPLRINLVNLMRMDPDERLPLEQYVEFLKKLRNDPAETVLTIRRDDLTYLASLYGMRPEALLERLKAVGVVE